MTMITIWKISAAIAGCLAFASGALAQQSVADFYKGKELILNIGSGVGGGYDTYARTLARHWGRHIPGNPNIVVKNMPGAQGSTMMNHLSVRAKTDGTEIGASFGQNLIEPVIDKGAVTKYDSRQMKWIGNISSQSMACFTWHTSKVKTIEQAMEHETIMASTGAINPSAIYANIFNRMMGTKFKVITGYTTAESTLAIERGEADGSCLSYATLVTEHPDGVHEKKVNWLAVVANKPDPNLPGIPTTTRFLKTEDDQKVVNVLISQLVMGRPFVAPPAIPADRLAALRSSFQAAMKDPAYLAEAEKQHQVVSPSGNEEMEKLVNDTYALPDDIIQKTVALIKGAEAAGGSEAPPKK
jgi:tripartite-type tricarboxylate transporter receptor subunit TctC